MNFLKNLPQKTIEINLTRNEVVYVFGVMLWFLGPLGNFLWLHEWGRAFDAAFGAFFFLSWFWNPSFSLDAEPCDEDDGDEPMSSEAQ